MKRKMIEPVEIWQHGLVVSNPCVRIRIGHLWFRCVSVYLAMGWIADRLRSFHPSFEKDKAEIERDENMK